LAPEQVRQLVFSNEENIVYNLDIVGKNKEKTFKAAPKNSLNFQDYSF
jgi:hypothetical protein